MPLYEYKCSKCGHVFERIQKFSDKPEADCPECGSGAERQLSAPAVHFKGTGWHITDYARKKKDGDSKPEETKPTSPDKSKSSDASSKKSPAKSKKKD